jgi:hypothetical protein
MNLAHFVFWAGREKPKRQKMKMVNTQNRPPSTPLMSNARKLVSISLLLLVAGCGVDSGRDAINLNSLLETGSVNRIDIVNENGAQVRTVSLTDPQQLQGILALFAGTNRVPLHIKGKTADRGRVLLFQKESVIGGLPWYSNNVFSFRNYEFRLKSPGELNQVLH